MFKRILLIIALTAFTCSSAFAQSAAMKKGLEELSAAKYSAALNSFVEAVKQNPADVQARYCLAVCFQHLQRYREASGEYKWVVTNAKDPALARRAQKGLSGCSGLLATATTSGTIASFTIPEQANCDDPTGAPTGATPGVKHAVLGQTNRPMQTAQRLPTPTDTGTPRLVDVYTDWCGWCKKFEPLFEQAQVKYGSNVQFERMNAEAPGNKELCQSWGVRSYPTCVFFDGSGKIVYVQKGCPKSFEIFDERIKSAFPQVSN